MKNHDNKDKMKQPFLKRFFRTFSLTEKIIFSLAGVVFLFTGLTLLLEYNESILETVPMQGGVINEGIVGTPRFINPILAISDVDKDIAMLTYSGLMRFNENNELVADLASSYTVSDDGLTYTFNLKEDITFHDGTEVTAQDIVFTIDKIKTDIIKSPQRGNWDSIEVRANGTKTVVFTLPNPFPAFLLNTTIGILPAHIWQGVADEEFPFADRNINPIGSGPFTIKEITKNSAGIAERYTLEPFENFTHGEPFIKEMSLFFYESEDALIEALKNKEVTSAGGVSPENVSYFNQHTSYNVHTYPLPRVFGVFFNQNQAQVLTSGNVREALLKSIDREALVQDILYGYGSVANSPIPDALLKNEYTSLQTEEVAKHSKEEALDLLTQAGFELNDDGVLANDDGQQVRFKLATADIPELVSVAQQLKNTWNDLGASIEVDVFSPTEFTQTIIRSRNYDAVLFGVVIDRDRDLYPFWHSSQRNDPGLNIANYANIEADAALEDARFALTPEEKIPNLEIIAAEIESDLPALFLYNPSYIYISDANLEGIKKHTITLGSERFTTIHTWFKDTDRVWSVFNQ